MLIKNERGDYNKICRDSLSALVSDGKEVSPRGQLTKEILGLTMVVNPLYSLLSSQVRKINYSFVCAENLWYLSGTNSYSLPTSYNVNYQNFSDGGIMQGAYGPPILEQIRYVVDCLKNDSDSRQAVISLWRPNPRKSKDTACTLSLHFMVRDDKLNLHVTMRSNDAIWGNNIDVPSFSMLQLVVAGLLNKKTGRLYLTANSFHVYERHFDLLDTLVAEDYTASDFSELPPMLECKVDDLKHHMDCIETVLACHYMLKFASSYSEDYFSHLPDFYKQYIYMMVIYFYKTPTLVEHEIKKLIDMKSPFGSIYYDRLLR